MTDRLEDEEIAYLRERLEKEDVEGNDLYEHFYGYTPELLDEIDRLRAFEQGARKDVERLSEENTLQAVEIERLRGDVDALLIKHGKLSEFCAKQSAALDEYVAEAERLRWFEENMDPWLTRHGPTRALFCSICKSYSHKPDCEYVLHGGKK